MGLLSFLFGSSAKPAQNKSYDYLQGAEAPNVATGTGATSMLGDFLGLGGNGASSAAYNNFLNMSGYGQALNRGIDAVNTNMYARGLGKSGADMKGIEQFRQGLNGQYLQSFMNNLLGLGQLGNQSASVISGAGEVGGTPASAGLIPTLLASAAQGAGAAASDRRLKRDIVKVGEEPDGLGIYEWHYVFDPGKARYRGVMADEVRRLRPSAYIENFRDGYSGVNYAEIGLRLELAA